MITSLLLQAALRSVFLALAVWFGLRLFGVRNVLAQKIAWGLVLASALVMPVVLPLAAHLPGLVIPSRLVQALAAPVRASAPETRQGETPEAVRTAVFRQSQPRQESGHRIGAQRTSEIPAVHVSTRAVFRDFAVASTGFRSPSPATVYLSQPSSAAPSGSTRTGSLSLLEVAGLIYLAVAGVLFVRLFYGLAVAVLVLRRSEPVHLNPSPLSDGLCLRVSDSVRSPVTIGSAVLLPRDYRQWDSEKLRIVLAHERSHVRQADFYIQLLAGVYAAAVWFSPLGWWLKRILSDLAEAISDHAGLAEARDRASYAQILLEFAAVPRPALTGVAMASTGSLSRRIERLLNEASFRQAFAGTRRGVAAVVLFPIMFFAVTTLVRLEASGQQAAERPGAPIASPAPPAVPATPAPPEGVSKPGQLEDEPPLPALAPQAPEPPPAPPAAGAPGETVAPLAPKAPEVPRVLILRDRASIATLQISPRVTLRTPLLLAPHVAPDSPSFAVVVPPPAVWSDGRAYIGSQNPDSTPRHKGYRYSYSSDGESYAIVRGDGSNHVTFNGDIHTSDIEKARKQAHGDFLWFTHDGKSYFVDDQAALTQIEAMYRSIEDLGRQQEELGKKQEELGRQQEELGRKQESAEVPAPDMKPDFAKIEETIARLKADQGKAITSQGAADLQNRLAELEAMLGEIQAKIGERQNELGAKMGGLGEKMGELGAEQGRLGAEQGRLGQQVDARVRQIIEQSLKNGKARPVE